MTEDLIEKVKSGRWKPESVDADQRNALADAMTTLFELLKSEPEASVRAILGHFLFTFIHPYMDGNGRLGRFLMNTMLASGGYDWIIIPVEKKNQYMNALEKASVEGNVREFVEFVAAINPNTHSPFLSSHFQRYITKDCSCLVLSILYLYPLYIK